MLHRSLAFALASFLSVPGISNALAAMGQPAVIGNWSAPAYWSPVSVKAASARPLSLEGDVTGALPFVAVTPCRQYDSRDSTSLPNNTPRTIAVSGTPCGIPSGAAAVSANVTIFNINAAGSSGVFKIGISAPPTTAWINFPPNETQRGNAGVLATDGSGHIVVQVNQGTGSVDLTVDINGYYVSTLNGGEQLLITANAGGGAIRGVNASGDGVQGQTSSLGSSGVYGNNTGGGKGVFGSSTSGNGVEGQSTSGSGVQGESTTGSGLYGRTAGSSGASGAAGVWGDTHDYFGVWGTSVAADGVHGQTAASTASGVAGFNTSSGAGVFGSSAQGDGVFGTGATGVHGTSLLGWGVYGHSSGSDGVHGDTTSNSSAGVAGIAINNGFGVYGSTNNGDGVYATAVGSATSANGVHAVGTQIGCGVVQFCSPGSLSLLAEGDAHFNNVVTIYEGLRVVASKNFVTPHPTDPTKQIAFVSLEGPESGTYFRGTSRLIGGYAEIAVPLSFRLVTSEEGLTAVATPSGSAASIFCVSKSLDKIVFQGSADVEFDYLVNGVRAGYENYDAIQNNVVFVPRGASDKTLTRLSGEAARRLKANGILNDDGTLNLETARKLGWDQRPGWNRVPPTPAVETKPNSMSN